MSKADDAKKIIDAVGGQDNVNNAWHCMTRLRFNIKNKDKINYDELKSLDAVVGTNYQGNQLQVVIGTNVADYYEPLAEQLGINTTADQTQEATPAPAEKQGIVSKLMDVVSGVFGPIVPAIAGAGMIKGLMAGMAALKWISNTTPSYQVIDMLASGVFTFLPFFVAISAGRIFKVNEFVSLAVAAAAGKLSNFMLFGVIPVPVFNYAGTVIPIILSIWLLSYVWKFVDKHLPDSMRTVFTPTITLFVGGLLALTVVGPIGIYGGNYLADGVRWLFSVSSVLAGVVVGAIRPIAIMTGLHHAMTPIALQNFATQGYDQLMPMMFMANMAIAGATLAIYFKTKDKKERSIVVSSAISAFLGITEPALFGVLTKYRKAFIAATIGSSVASAFISFFGVRIYAFILSSIFSLPAYIGKYFIPAVLGIIIAVGTSFAITMFLLKTEDAGAAEKDLTLSAVTTGEYMPLEELNDGVFSKKMLGDGYAMKSDDGVVFSPVNGRIATVFPTKHAIGITTDSGIDVLVHMGIDTVDLAGKPFEVLVNTGDRVTPHTQIAQMDLQAIADAGKDSTIVVVVTNMDKINNLKHQYTLDQKLTGGQLVANAQMN